MSPQERFGKIAILFSDMAVEFSELAKLARTGPKLQPTPPAPVKKTRKKKATASSEFDGKVINILDYYRKIHPGKGKGVKAGHRLWALIVSRLEEGYTVPDLKKAIDGNLICDWHKNNASGHTLEYIFRDSTKVDGFIEKAKRGPKQEKENGHHQGSSGFADGDRDFDLG